MMGTDDCTNRWRPHAEDEEPRLCAGPGEDTKETLDINLVV